MDDKSVKTANVYVLDKKTVNHPMFDLIPGKPGHVLDMDGRVKEVRGVRITVPLLDINPATLFQIADFVDEMDGVITNSAATIVVKEVDKENNIPAKIGVFSV